MVTIAQVARHAGVGVSTVSRVLNDHPSVRPTTRARVQAAIAELDYRPSPLARGLKHGRVDRIAVLVSFFTSPSAVERLRGLTQALSGTGYELVVYPVLDDEQRRKHLASLSGPHRADGIVLITLPLDDEELARLTASSISVIQIDGPHPGVSTVAVDDVRGGELAAAHLLQLGHEAIGFVGDRRPAGSGFTSSRDRQAGFLDRLREAGVSDPERFVRLDVHGVDQAAQMAGDLLAGAERPSAVFAASDLQALGVLRAARQLRLRVPQDLSVLGFDDIDAARHVGLSTIRQPLQDSGRLAAELLLQDLADPSAAGAQRHVLPLQVVPRSTTAPPGL